MQHPSPLATARDLLELAKPRITLLVLFTTSVGLALAPGPRLGLVPALGFLAATACLVASANTLNCWYERESDGRMIRTRDRALPTGRIAPALALAAGLLLGASALAGLAATTNALTLGLGALALATYVGAYTPLKRVSWLALLIGAVPGAIPPLMGATARAGRIEGAGLVLAAILFFWQLPHFIAIALHHKEDYRRGGLRVLPLVHGDVAARRHLFAYTVLLVLASLAALPLGMAGTPYAAAAVLLGGGFLAVALRGLRPDAAPGWARQAFAYSLVYLPLLIGILVLDAR
jgi:protoheme IX farnesyltransferase